jgi:hypothetical protein
MLPLPLGLTFTVSSGLPHPAAAGDGRTACIKMPIQTKRGTYAIRYTPKYFLNILQPFLFFFFMSVESVLNKLMFLKKVPHCGSCLSIK